MKSNLAIGTAVLAALAMGVATAQDAQNSSKSNVTFSSVDTNKDGHISKDEVRYMEDLNGSFAKLDTNGDGMLSQAEFGKYTASGASSQSSSSSSSASPSSSSPSSSSTPSTDKSKPDSTR